MRASHSLRCLTLWIALASPAAAAAGLPVTLVDPANGERVKLEAGGAALHVVFFATWCPACRAELQALSDLEDRWGERGYRLVVVAVQARHDRARLAQFVEDRHPPGRVLFDTEGAVQKSWQASHVPTHLVFDAEGREVARSGALDAAVTRAIERLVARRARKAEGGE